VSGNSLTVDGLAAASAAVAVVRAPADSRASDASATIERAVNDVPLNRRHAIVFSLCSAGLFFESLNLQLMSFVAPRVAREWGFGPRMLGMVISAAIAGMMLGTYVFGAVADRHGRRLAFQSSVGIFSVMTALAGGSSALWQLIAARFGAGIGIGGSIPVEAAVLTEFTPLTWRARALALWGIFLPLGGFVAPLCVAVMPPQWGWRGLLFLGGIPAFLVLIARRAIPETPQYLATKGRMAQARAAVAWIAMRSGGPPIASATAENEYFQPKKRAPERILFSPEYRRATATSWMLYFGTFFSYYGFILWMPALLGGYRGYTASEVIRFMLGLSLAGLSGRVAMIFAIGRIPRRPLIITWAVLGALGLVGFAAPSDHAHIMIAGYIAAFFLEGIFGAVIPFVAESYPAESRATGVGWAGGMGRLGATLAPLAIGPLVRIDVQYAIMTLAVGSVLAGIAMLFSRWWPE
jgi:MFS transporter, putative metabolite:H+ symporter